MTVPTLVQVFGANATQTSTQLIISKADLVATGLTVSNTNTANSLLVALILQWQSYLNVTNQANNSDQNITIEDSYSSIVSRNSLNYRQDTKTINIQRIDSTASIDPDNY
ncbi:MAG: hypothetical protein DSM106950_01365 [Stigonema ocellatum SAG 48.90 = DSM 106950]|nr:hypothetical protein [Stigonema ocellatum SAG 48.90 = DSM 106950]